MFYGQEKVIDRQLCPMQVFYTLEYFSCQQQIMSAQNLETKIHCACFYNERFKMVASERNTGSRESRILFSEREDIIHTTLYILEIRYRK